MSASSEYCIPCLCGATVQSHDRETRCEKCGRVLIVEWGEKRGESEAKAQKAGSQ